MWPPRAAFEIPPHVVVSRRRVRGARSVQPGLLVSLVRLYLVLEFNSSHFAIDIFSTSSAACRIAWAVHV